MFTKLEKKLIYNNYFEIIRETEDYIEFKSKCTKHCWIVQKTSFTGNKKIYIYHKHSMNIKYYHKHWQTYTVQMAVESIIKHDKYVKEFAYH